MILVEPHLVGACSLARMARDGVVLAAGHGAGVPADVSLSPAVRAASMARCVTPGGALTGLAALWVWGFRGAERPPWLVDVAVPRGSNPDAPAACRVHGWRCATDSTAVREAATLGGVRVATLEAALATAFAIDPWRAGLDAAQWTLRHGVSREGVASAISRQAPSERRARASAAWATVATALAPVDRALGTGDASGVVDAVDAPHGAQHGAQV